MRWLGCQGVEAVFEVLEDVLFLPSRLEDGFGLQEPLEDNLESRPNVHVLVLNLVPTS